MQVLQLRGKKTPGQLKILQAKGGRLMILLGMLRKSRNPWRKLKLEAVRLLALQLRPEEKGYSSRGNENKRTVGNITAEMPTIDYIYNLGL